MDYNVELLETAKSGNVYKVKQCLENGADINFVDERNNTAIMYASMNGHLEVVKFLMETLTAKIGIKNIDGKDAMELAKTSEIREYIKRTVRVTTAYAPRKAFDSTNKVIEIFGKNQYDNTKSYVRKLYNDNPALWKERLIEYMIPVIATINYSNLPSFDSNLMPKYIKKAKTFIAYDRQLSYELRIANSANHSMTYCIEVAYLMIELCMTEIECGMFVENAQNEVMRESMSSFFPF